MWSKQPESIMSIITNRGVYRYSALAYEECPNEMKKTSDPRIAPSAFERMPKLFQIEKPVDGLEYIQIYGNLKGIREYRWFRKDYVKETENLNHYKVVVPKANGSGEVGEILSMPIILKPQVGFTETYISIGLFDNYDESRNVLKYVKTKFVRIMLSILKVTQNNPRDVWKYVPMQNFTNDSDIDWSKSIDEIDQQLYKKYDLSKDEIEFVESKAKPMI